MSEKSEQQGVQDAPAAAPPPVVYFDFIAHETAQRHHKAGIWTDLGPRYNGLQVRLRPFHVQAVQVKRETIERAIRAQLGLREDEDIPAERSIEVNRAAVTMAITGARGKILGSPDMIAKAKKLGVAVAMQVPTPDGGSVNLIDFSGAEASEVVREIFSPVLDESMPFLTTCIRASQALQKLQDKEINALGEDFIYGQHVKVDWRD